MRILLLAGEESGVMYAERIAEALREKRPAVEIRGYGDYGFRTGDLAVMGLGQVLRRIFYFLGVKRTMERAIDEWRPDVVCTVDYPGLNLKLAAYAKSQGIRTVHVVCPQVWAWKKGRIPKIEAALDRLCCFFPFEPALFKPGFAEFVGHPLVDAFASEAKAKGVGEQRSGKTLALLPGSRLGEIEKHLPTLLKVVETLQREIPDLKVIIPAANDRAYEKIQEILGALGTLHCSARRGTSHAERGGRRGGGERDGDIGGGACGVSDGARVQGGVAVRVSGAAVHQGHPAHRACEHHCGEGGEAVSDAGASAGGFHGGEGSGGATSAS